MRSSFAVGLCAAILLSAAGQTRTRAPRLASDVDIDAVRAGFNRLTSASGIVGASLLVLRNRAVILHANTGYQDLERKVAVDDDTIFHWASITKTFTGIGIMQLRDRGLLSLDDPVVKYVPELRAIHDPFGDVSDIKIRHLMSHSAGFRASTWPWGGDQPWHPFEPTSWEQLVAMLPYTEVEFAPGSRYRYSNPGVIFLGRIIALLSGDDYEVYIDKNIFMPLDMTRSFFDRAPQFLLPRRSHSYAHDDHGVRELRFDFDTGITVSNGGLNAPFTDMARYLAFLLDVNPNGARVLKRTSLDEMWTPQIRAREGEGTNGRSAQAGLSFFIERYGDVELVGHSGDQNGFLSHLYLHAPSRTAWLIAFNTEVTPSKDHARPGTRDVDLAVRDLMLRNVIR
jgi:CubicO group peptidase (beta-lactamase class C family)